MRLKASSKYATPDNPFYFTCITVITGFINTLTVQFFANKTVVVQFLNENETCILESVFDEHYNATCVNVTSDPQTVYYILEIPKPEEKDAVDFYCRTQGSFSKSNEITLDFPRKCFIINLVNV